MHYRNGREAKNGDRVVMLEAGQVIAFGTLTNATPGSDYCNGNVVHDFGHSITACLCDCMHLDDVAELLAEKGLDKRPDGM